jgi:AcrR family transcriptional regulator
MAVKRKAGPRSQRWTQNPEAVKREILDVATQEFARKGLSGARVDEIAARTSTAKRMIYYYFGDKEGLYQAVLEAAYGHIRELERALDLAALPPAEALAELVRASFDHHADHPEFVRLVMVENIHDARHLKASAIGAVNSSAIAVLSDIHARGVAEGVFRPGLAPLDIHLTISALSFYNVSNRATILEGFGHDMAAPEARAARREAVVEAVLRYVRP